MRRCAWVVLLAVLTLPTVVQGDEVKRYPIPLGSSPSTGPADAPVTVVEFLDFQ